MGSFAKSLAGVMFGWVSDVISRIWALFTTDSGTDSIPWIGKHWILLVVFLCVLGLLIDFVIYLYRWKPYKVWASFFRKRRANRTEDVNEDAEDFLSDKRTTPDEQYITGHTAECDPGTEKMSDEQFSVTGNGTAGRNSVTIMNGSEAVTAKMHQKEAGDPADPYAAYRRPDNKDRTEERIRDRELSDQWQTGTGREETRQNRRRRTVSEPRRSRIVRNLLGDDEGDPIEETYNKRPLPAVSREDAYREPVYPPQWKQNRKSGDNDTYAQ